MREVSGAEAAAIRGVGVLGHEVGAAIGQRDDVGHRVGVVAGQSVGRVHLVAEVGAVDIPRGHVAAAIEIAQDSFHATHEREHIAGGDVIHDFREASAQSIVAVGDVFGGDARVPVNRSGAVVLVIREPPGLSAAGGIGQVAAGIVTVVDG